jgi:hypothetical protein
LNWRTPFAFAANENRPARFQIVIEQGAQVCSQPGGASVDPAFTGKRVFAKTSNQSIA